MIAAAPMTGNARLTHALPPVSGLIAEPPSTWHALAERLRKLGLQAEEVAPIARAAADMPEPLRAPVWSSLLAGRDDPLGVAMRLLMFGLCVTEDKAEAALGSKLVSRLGRAGLLTAQAEHELRSLFWLSVANDKYVICDDLSRGGAAVMGAGQTTAELCRAAHPVNRVASVLDLGCGAGTVALLFASHAENSVGTDVNPRAVALSRVNAELNRVANARFEQGDLFAPVREASFDLIVSPPPFVPRVEGTRPAIYLYGGARGDELPLRVLHEVPAHLAPGGRAVFLIEWPVVDSTPLEQRVREAVADPSVSILVVRLPPYSDLDVYCIRYASFFHPRLGAAYGRAVARMRRHLEKLNVQKFQPSLVVLQASGRGHAWVSTVDVTNSEALTSHLLQAMVGARDLLARDEPALLAATLRMPDDLVVQREHGVRASETCELRLRRAGRAYPAMDVSPGMLDLMLQVDASPSVDAACRTLREGASGSTVEGALQGVREALLRGLLEPV